MRSRRTTAVFALVVAISLCGAAAVSQRVDALRAGATLEETLYLPSAHTLKRLSLGYDGLLADIYWTRVVQYFGRKHLAGAMQYKLLGPLLDITTELDPHLIVAYQFGSVFLSQQPPQGAGDPRKAAQLVEKGIRANPNDWHLYFDLGFINYSELQDYPAAEKAFERGSRVPGANPALRVMAAAMAQHAGELELSRYMWTQIYNTTNDKMIRANAVRRLRALQVDEDIGRLQRALDHYRDVYGRYPVGWAELLAAGWRGQMADPLGRPYLLKPGGRVQVQDPDALPFITKGLPPGQGPVVLGPVPTWRHEPEPQLAAPESKH